MFATSFDAAQLANPRLLPSAVVVEEQASAAFDEYFTARTHSIKSKLRKILIAGNRPDAVGGCNTVSLYHLHEKVAYSLLACNISSDAHVPAVLLAGGAYATATVAAVKAIRALRQWAYQHFRSGGLLHLVVMATPEDIAANAEHMRLADEFVHVPGGSALKFNVELVVNIAQRCGVDAVWPGCGLLAANQRLPQLLRAKHIGFMGPSVQTMARLNSQVNTLVMAQSLGLSTLPWSGSDLRVEGMDAEGAEGYAVPPELSRRAVLKDIEHAERVAKMIGYPVIMLPADAATAESDQGGWTVENTAELHISFKRLEKDMSHGHFVIMLKKPASYCRVGVQVLADTRGTVVCVAGFDCSIQIQGQNTISEAPPAEVPPMVQKAMATQAQRLAQRIGFTGVGTAEFAYRNGQSFFLGLMPSLHEDFPLLEAITGVNFVAAQLHIAMDVPLQRIPDIRRLYNVHTDGLDMFEFESRQQLPPVGHCIAAKITAHDPNANFEHTYGKIQEILYSSYPGVFLYFSVGNAGFLARRNKRMGVKHVFGHVFAHGPSRTDAVPKLATALMELVVLGDVVCDSKHLASVIEQPEFLFTAHYANWLNGGGTVTKEVGGRVATHVVVVCGAVVKAHMRRREMEEEAISALQRGISPDITRVNFTEHAFDLCFDRVKYLLQVSMGSPSMYLMRINSDVVETEAVLRSDGGLLIMLDGRTYTVYYESMRDGFKVHVNGHRCFFPDDFDPTCLTAPYPGKLLRFLVEEGQRLALGQPFAEVELMKTVVPLVSGTEGVVHHVAANGAALRTGDIICRVTLDSGVEIPRPEVWRGSLPPLKLCRVDPANVEGNTYLQFQMAYEAVFKILMGYKNVAQEQDRAQSPLENLLATLAAPSLVLCDFREQKASVSEHVSAAALEALTHIEDTFHTSVAQGSKVRTGVRGDDIVVATREVSRFLDKFAEHDIPELQSFVARYKDGLFHHEAQVLCQIVDEFLRVEVVFSEVPTFEDAMLSLAEQNHGNLYEVTYFAHSHSKLHQKLELIVQLLAHMDSLGMVEIPVCVDRLQSLAALTGVMYGEVASLAKAIIIKKQEYARYSARKWKNMKKSIFTTMNHLLPLATPPNEFDDSAENSATASAHNQSTPHCSVDNLQAAWSTASGSSPAVSAPVNLPSTTSATRPCAKPPGLPKPPSLAVVASSDMTATSDTPASPSPTASGIAMKKSIFARMKERATVMRLEVEKAELQCATPGKTVTSLTDHFLMISALFNRTEPAISTNAIKKMFEFQGINDVVCTVEDMGVIRAHMSNSTDTWILGNMEEAKYVLGNKLGENYYQLLKMVSAASTKGHVPRDLGVVFVSLIEPTSTKGMAQFHFRRQPPGGRVWCEDTNVREIPAAFVAFMELSRLSCFNAQLIAASDSTYSSLSIPLPPVTHKIEYSTLIFLATEKKPPLKGTRRDQRIFLRTMVHNKELFLGAPGSMTAASEDRADTKQNGMKTSKSLMFMRQMGPPAARRSPLLHDSMRESVMGEERVLGDLLAQMELAVMSKKTAAFNYMFVNLTNSTKDDIPAVKETTTAFLEQCRRDLRRLRVAWIEVKVGPGRLVAYNPNGYQYKMEFHNDTKAPLPYPVLNRIQRRRMYAQSLGTTFIYDFVDMFSFHANTFMQSGAEGRGAGRVTPPGSATDLGAADTAERKPCFRANELVLNSEGQLEEIERPIGCNDVGMVVWRCKVHTREYPAGRNFILVGNDVTHIGGSFSPEEDNVYDKAVKLAQHYQIPFVYISSNSGARVGLDEAVKACFRVEWEDPRDPARGVNYFYLTDEDYKRLTRTQKVMAERMETASGVRWRLDNLVGGIGQECLQGSGVIASATSEAYDNIFTLTFVTGRSIGIGAYVARLTNRVIQHQDAPLILTDASALNKILGREVYCNNNQIGGPKVMYHNGVAHQVVQDDLQGVGAILHWLSFVPCRKGAPLPYCTATDPIERPLTYYPTRAPHDPRLMLHAFFDTETFHEVMGEWGKTVVTGRARLGGLPIGVVAVENRVTEKMVPADPAFAGAQQLVEQQPGQVWFPDSAFKTAQAISDMDREGLPLIIFANWRGFAGGLRDMFGEVLKYGSMIVDNSGGVTLQLRVFNQPIFVYIPYEAEIRGGAWVVIDKSINPEQMEMYAAEVCRGGVLEPEATAELKFKEADILKAMHRIDPSLASLSPEELESAQFRLWPAFKHMAVLFAAMHDRPEVMLQKGVIESVVQWADSRTYFARQLRRRLAQEALKRKAREAWPGAKGDHFAKEAVTALSQHVEMVVQQEGEVRMDFVDVTNYMKKIRQQYIAHRVAELAEEDEEVVRQTMASFVPKKSRRQSSRKEVDEDPRIRVNLSLQYT